MVTSFLDAIDALEVDLGRLAGLFLGEYVPERDDPHRLSALTAARIVSVAAGLVVQGR